MFKELLNLEKDRSTKEAIGFYIAYVIVAILALFILGMLMEIIFSIGYENGKKFGQVFSIIMPPIISFMIISSKNILNFKYALFSLLAGILGLFGVFVGFIPVAFLTTRKSNKH